MHRIASHKGDALRPLLMTEVLRKQQPFGTNCSSTHFRVMLKMKNSAAARASETRIHDIVVDRAESIAETER